MIMLQRAQKPAAPAAATVKNFKTPDSMRLVHKKKSEEAMEKNLERMCVLSPEWKK